MRFIPTPVPIEKDYRVSWKVTEEHNGHAVWTTHRREDGVIHGTTVGVHMESCVGCMKCITACPTDVFTAWADSTGRNVVDPVRESECILCLVCEMVCPTDAISITKAGGSEDTLKSLLE